ncbi:pentatricopeptide repeat-containing protein At1g06270-like [Zingiber officinale]|uniref:pentatricopeptide repeat-containing protein At1g06270-like n=1 Tax=Zingiber officinale TaxID=94328 RepID=UPI001C4DCE41|nr:pentatricopeptide repeat-containing protein At1g06270-like [Zingiber officinale]
MAYANPLGLFRCCQRRRFSASIDPIETPLQLAVRSAVQSGDHISIPRLLNHYSHSSPNPNAFSFLIHLPPTLAAATIADLLSSFNAVRPRSIPFPAYADLLSLTLPNPIPSSNPPSSIRLPSSLAVLQLVLRSGIPPPRETRLALPLNWIAVRHRCSVAGIISSLRPLGFRAPDLNTLNYLISSLCASQETEEAASVLRGMSAAGIDPDSGSYCEVIEAMDGEAAPKLLVEMVVRRGMAPRKGTVARVVEAMRAEGKAGQAADLVRVLERSGCAVGFEAYEAAVEGCLKSREVVAAARVVAEMAAKGFVPYIGVRQRVVEGLSSIGQSELAAEVRRRLAEIRS